MSAPHMGLLASSIDSSASISTRTMPLASFTQASAWSSVTRRLATIARRHAVLAHLLLDLRARAVHQHHAHLQAHQHVDVVGELLELAVGEHLAAEGDDERRPAPAMDVGRGGAKPLDEGFGLERGGLGHGRANSRR